MRYTYAIGDIHGRENLLERLHARIETDPYRPIDAGRPLVVHLGDYIDGGPDSDKVLDRIMRGSPHFDSIALLGNHEALMLDCLDSDDRDVWWNWLSNGGDRTLDALGVSTRMGGYDPQALAGALGEKRIAWLRSLPTHYIAGRYLFVHAGIVPGLALERQATKDMLWIRSRFLESQEDHG
jgi:serine/threonine protein phosphatase 1